MGSTSPTASSTLEMLAMHVGRVFFHPSGKPGTISTSSLVGTIIGLHRKLFNLRHSSLRVTVERAFGALKNRFKILDQKPFHPYSTQVKLVLACCILHNWILQWGFDEHVPEEEEVEPDDVVSSGHGVEAFDNDAWKNKRLEWAEAMWLNRGQCRI